MHRTPHLDAVLAHDVCQQRAVRLLVQTQLSKDGVGQGALRSGDYFRGEPHVFWVYLLHTVHVSDNSVTMDMYKDTCRDAGHTRRRPTPQQQPLAPPVPHKKQQKTPTCGPAASMASRIWRSRGTSTRAEPATPVYVKIRKQHLVNIWEEEMEHQHGACSTCCGLLGLRTCSSHSQLRSRVSADASAPL